MAPKDKQATVEEFRELLASQDLIREGDTIGTDDETLHRFLRARSYNLKNAATMWKNCLEWRRTVEDRGIDQLYRDIDPFDYPERDLVFESWPLYFHKLDKEGHPINIHHFGRIDLTKLGGKMSLERFWQTVLVNCEALPREVLPAATEAAGKPILGTCVVIDLSGFGIGQFWHMKDFARSSFQVSQDYFPETVARLAIVNAPRGFTAIWNVMKPWIAKETAAKVTIMGSDYKSKLLDFIDADSLPTYLGGACTCDGQGGCKKSNAGPWMHNRRRRRELWLEGRRDTCAIKPGELGQEQVSEDAALREEDERAPAEETEAGTHTPPTQRKGLSGSTSETSSVETSSPTTPSFSVHEDGDSHPDPHKLDGPPGLSQEKSVDHVYEQHPETRQVQGGALHKEAPVQVVAH
ncbi:CRAL/TRIO domain-containing protein [Dichomitus squalens]|nr:CRAL/TRIO domain-containing protein [Dichomitus squalens]